MARSVHSVRANTRPAARDFAIRLLKPAASALVVLCMSAPGTVASAGVEQGDESFTFGMQDEATLEAAHAAEAQLRRYGLVYEDDALTASLADVARRLLPEKVPARVTWRFLALRDCMPNAWAFPSGSIYVTSGMLALSTKWTKLPTRSATGSTSSCGAAGTTGSRERASGKRSFSR